MDVQLLGSAQVRFGQQQVVLPQTKPMLLLFYLALTRTWVSRSELASFFRPDADKATARHYVRKMLNSALQMPWGHGLEVHNDLLRWQVDTDVARFTESARAGRYQEATELYRGPLLSGLQIDNLPSYEAWLELEREEIDMLWYDACLKHATELESAGDHYEAAALVKRVLQRDNLAEGALQSYLRNSYLAGQREVALTAATAFERDLYQDVGLEPLEETKQLIAAIAASQPVARSVSPVKHGRRRTDRPQLPLEEQLRAEVLELLQDPDVRLLDIPSEPRTGKNVFILAHRIPEFSKALQLIVDFAAALEAQGHYSRALELVQLASIHPDSDAKVKASAQRLQTHLETLLTAPQINGRSLTSSPKSQSSDL